jgi:hypothetical protein
VPSSMEKVTALWSLSACLTRCAGLDRHSDHTPFAAGRWLGEAFGTRARKPSSVVLQLETCFSTLGYFRAAWNMHPSKTPSAPSPSPATNEPDDEEQQYRTDGCVDDGADHSNTEMDTKLGQQPTSNKGAHNSDNQVADDSKTSPLHDLARKPAGNETYEQHDQQALARHMHFVTSMVRPGGSITSWSDAVCINLISLPQIRFLL